MDGISIALFVKMSIIAVAAIFILIQMYERLLGGKISDNKKQAFVLMAVYACFIFQIAFYRRIGTERVGINTRIYLGLRRWDGSIDAKQVVYSFLNVVFFIPWGFLLAWAMNGNVRRIVMTIVYSFLTSLSIETIQFLTRTGASEVTDLLTNVSGGFIGCLIYIFICSVSSSRSNRKGRK